MFAAMTPPTMAHAQQQMLGMLTKGIAERIPRITPPINAGFILSFMFVYTFTQSRQALGERGERQSPPPRVPRLCSYTPGPPKPPGGGGGGGAVAPPPLPKIGAPITPPSSVKTKTPTAIASATTIARTAPENGNETPPCSIRSVIAAAPTRRIIGIPMMRLMAAPMPPAIAPSDAPWPGVTVAPVPFTYRKTAKMPPPMAHRQQQLLSNGNADRRPATTPPMSAAFVLGFIFCSHLPQVFVKLWLRNSAATGLSSRPAPIQPRDDEGSG